MSKETYLKLTQYADIEVVELDGTCTWREFPRVLDCNGFEAARTRTPKDFWLIVDEIGRYCPENIVNLFAGYLYGDMDNGIVGDALIGKSGFRNGEPDIVGLTDEDIQMILNLLHIQFPLFFPEVKRI